MKKEKKCFKCGAPIPLAHELCEECYAQMYRAHFGKEPPALVGQQGRAGGNAAAARHTK